jgi:transketolase
MNPTVTGCGPQRESATILACGPMVPEAMRAAWILKEEYAIETRIVNVHTVKPLDVATLLEAADETRILLTAEEHQVGGFGNIVAGAMLRNRKNFRQPCSSIWWASPIASVFRAIPGN